jgi:hypothetical protein
LLDRLERKEFLNQETQFYAGGKHNVLDLDYPAAGWAVPAAFVSAKRRSRLSYSSYYCSKRCCFFAADCARQREVTVRVTRTSKWIGKGAWDAVLILNHCSVLEIQTSGIVITKRPSPRLLGSSSIFRGCDTKVIYLSNLCIPFWLAVLCVSLTPKDQAKRQNY